MTSGEIWSTRLSLRGMTDTAGIVVSVVPSQSAYFAGEDFSVLITFTNLNQPSTSYAHHFHQPRTTTAPTFAPTHRRSARSVAYPANIPHTPRTAASFANVASLPVDSPFVHREVDSQTPRRRGLVGKGKEREDPDDPDLSLAQAAQIPPVSQFKRKHIPKSLSMSSSASGGTRTRLPKLDVRQPDSPLTNRTPGLPLERVIYMTQSPYMQRRKGLTRLH